MIWKAQAPQGESGGPATPKLEAPEVRKDLILNEGQLQKTFEKKNSFPAEFCSRSLAFRDPSHCKMLDSSLNLSQMTGQGGESHVYSDGNGSTGTTAQAETSPMQRAKTWEAFRRATVGNSHCSSQGQNLVKLGEWCTQRISIHMARQTRHDVWSIFFSYFFENDESL